MNDVPKKLRFGSISLVCVLATTLVACGAPSPTGVPSGAEASGIAPSAGAADIRTDLDAMLDARDTIHPDGWHGMARADWVAAADDVAARAGSLTRDEQLVELVRLAAMPSWNGRDGHTGIFPFTPEDGTLLYSTHEAAGEVGVVVYPWEISLAREAPADSALNHVRATVRSLVALGNRVRVRAGALTAEITTASAERLGLREGDVVVASFKATGTRLLPR